MTRWGTLAAILVCASAGLAQRVISAHAAVVAFRAGPVLVDNQPLQVPYQMQDGQTLKTTDRGVAELLLLPTVFLRMDESSSILIEDATLANTQVAIQEGSVFFEFGKLLKDSRLRVHFRDSSVEFKHDGIYQLDARQGSLRVYKGEAVIERPDKTVVAKRGKAVNLAGDLAVSNFDPNQLQFLISWAAQRSWQRMNGYVLRGLRGYTPALTLPASTSAATEEVILFRGNLERITAASISIRLPDGVIIDARIPNTGVLTGSQLAERHQIGDPVEIACKRIQPTYDPQARLYRYLELTRFRSPMKPPSPRELSDAYAARRVWREPGNLLKPSLDASLPAAKRAASDPTGLLQRARDINLRQFAELAKFAADETATRLRRFTGGKEWQPADTFESEVRGGTEARRRIVKDGMPWLQPFEAISGFLWNGGFAAQSGPFLQSLNGAPCDTVVEFDGRQTLRDQRVSVYKYSAPPDGCFHSFTSGYQRYFPAFTGRLFLDESSGNIVRYEEKAGGFPPAFAFVQSEKTVDWSDIKIGDELRTLPVAATFLAQFSNGVEWSVKVEYKNHRPVAAP